MSGKEGLCREIIKMPLIRPKLKSAGPKKVPLLQFFQFYELYIEVLLWVREDAFMGGRGYLHINIMTFLRDVFFKMIFLGPHKKTLIYQKFQ